LISQIKFVVMISLVALAARTAIPQEKPALSPRPAPQIAGSFIDTDGKQRLTLQYHRNIQPEVFTGTIQSTCMIPAPSKSAESRPLDLSAIPLGTHMTIFYVRHVVGKQSQNVILAVRFDHVRSASALPQGVVIPCVKGGTQSTP
jgi:hypothetical protein